MSIPARPTGQDPQSQLLWQISKQLDKLIKQTSEKFSVEKQLAIIEPLCVALNYVHQHNVIHRSLSPETVFVSDDGKVKLGDFDFAKSSFLETISVRNQPLDSSPFVSPELIIDLSLASPLSDIFSLGMLWYYLALFPDDNSKITSGSINKLDIPQDAKDLIKSMTAHAPESRPKTVEMILKRIEKIKKSLNLHQT